MIKTILVPTTGTAADDACFPAAAALARRLAAHLDFLHVRQDAAELLAALSDSGAFPFPNQLVDELERTEAVREAAAKRKVEQFRAADGAPLAGPAFWAAIGQGAEAYPLLTLGNVPHNIAVASVGNLVGGSLMVGAVYWSIYLRRRG